MAAISQARRATEPADDCVLARTLRRLRDRDHGSGRPQTPERLPDAEVTHAAGLSAWLIDPTLRYTYGVLGDAAEAIVVKSRLASGASLAAYRIAADAIVPLA